MNRLPTIQIFVLIFTVFLEVALMPHLSVFGFWPSLILLIALSLILLGFEKEAFFAAGIGGIMLDFFSPLPFGVITAVYLSISLVLKFLMSRFLNHLNLFSIFAIFCLIGTIIQILSILILKNASWYSLPVAGFYTGIIGLAIYFGLNSWAPTEQILGEK